uniref:Uncharacterized protein n=1 Tax=Brassica oleracea var. oleracea TaxID=109376 RepID=A0A0D3ATZ6_BRAOL
MVLSLVRQQVPWGEEKSREKKRGGGEKKDLERLRSSPEFVIASAPRDKVELATTVNRRPSSCSSRQDEAVDTNHASIGARTKLHTPPKDSPRRARETHAPPPSAATPPPDHRPPPQLRRRRRPTFRFGVHLSSWSSYIPLLFIAKHPIPHWAIPLSLTPPSFPLSGETDEQE